jgi:RNA polymerase sigma-54 factor
MPLSLVQKQRQSQTISPRQLMQVKMLARSLPELRASIIAEMAANPAIEDFDHPLETPLSEIERRSEDGAEPDYPEDDFEPGMNYDEAAAERRQAFFDNQVKEETLQEHLVAQLPLSDIPEGDWPMAEVLIGDLDDKGFYKGSVADVAMAYERPEGDVVATLARIRELDPPGCGARDVRECLLSQLGAIADRSLRGDVRRIVDGHLEDVAAGRLGDVAAALGVDDARCREALAALRTLDARPGRQYPSERERVEYVNPEIHAVRRNGRWVAETDARSLPEIRLSSRFMDLLKDPNQSAETKAYVAERIEAAKAFREAVAKRQETVSSIANYIFSRQQDFFSGGLAALKPLTELEVAKAVGVHGTTVSRTVRDKYASTPQGTVELRRFFATGVKTGDGGTVSQDAVLAALRGVIADEDAEAPLSDEKISARLKELGFPVARRTVAKYRDKLGIPGATERMAPRPLAKTAKVKYNSHQNDVGG